VFDYIPFSKFHTHNRDDTIPRLNTVLKVAVFWVVTACTFFSLVPTFKQNVFLSSFKVLV
jgi:hypothetical protein